MTIQITVQAETGVEARQKLSQLLDIDTSSADRLAFRVAALERFTGGVVRPVQNDGQLPPPEDVTEPETGLSTYTQDDLVPSEMPSQEQTTKRKRRTKAEMAAAQQQVQGRTAEEPAQISTGEARAAPDDPPEVQAQDEADEQAESARAVTQQGPAPTRDTLRDAMNDYVQKFGTAPAMEDGPRIFEAALGAVPPGTKNAKGIEVKQWVLTAVPDDRIAECLAAWREALAKNPFERDRL